MSRQEKQNLARSTVAARAERDVREGAQYACTMQTDMHKEGLPTGNAVHFHIGFLGAWGGDIVAHFGKEMALQIFDVVRSELERAPIDKKQPATRH